MDHRSSQERMLDLFGNARNQTQSDLQQIETAAMANQQTRAERQSLHREILQAEDRITERTTNLISQMGAEINRDIRSSTNAQLDNMRSSIEDELSNITPALVEAVRNSRREESSYETMSPPAVHASNHSTPISGNDAMRNPSTVSWANPVQQAEEVQEPEDNQSYGDTMGEEQNSSPVYNPAPSMEQQPAVDQALPGQRLLEKGRRL